MEIKFDRQFQGISYVWTIMRKFLTQDINDSIRGMRVFKDQNGAVFDVPEENIDRFEDIFNHLKNEQRVNFEIGRAKALPELKEDEVQGDFGNRGGYGGDRNGYRN